ncbi:peptidoglycan-binding protein [Aerosakkonemataceae cyanobacterium BLCC-F50]|uniref:Peptidoglycan-binding protein n=1 Tax=Floridaenema flaviceps BLCC-F50 TaxID=3153642 RepID=A0ABV4Y0Y3_9CYAN
MTFDALKSNRLVLGAIAAISVTSLSIGGIPAFAATPNQSSSTSNSQSNTTTAASNANPSLKLGSRGDSVKKLQQYLKENGFYKGEINGNFDKNTRAAVIAFQKSKKVRADGVVGASTWALMQ